MIRCDRNIFKIAGKFLLFIKAHPSRSPGQVSQRPEVPYWELRNRFAVQAREHRQNFGPSAPLPQALQKGVSAMMTPEERAAERDWGKLIRGTTPWYLLLPQFPVSDVGSSVCD